MVLLAVNHKSCNIFVAEPCLNFLLRDHPSLFILKGWLAVFSQPELWNATLCSHNVMWECYVLCGTSWLRRGTQKSWESWQRDAGGFWKSLWEWQNGVMEAMCHLKYQNLDLNQLNSCVLLGQILTSLIFSFPICKIGRVMIIVLSNMKLSSCFPDKLKDSNKYRRKNTL